MKLFPFIKQKDSRYVGFNSRMVTALIDTILLGLILSPFFKYTNEIIFNGTSISTIANEILAEANANKAAKVPPIMSDPRMIDFLYNQDGLLKVFADIGSQVIVYGALILMFWAYKQATPGKMLFAHKIVDSKTFQPPTKIQFLKRICGYLISILPLFLGFIWIAFDKRKQSWHDKFAGTVVVKNGYRE